MTLGFNSETYTMILAVSNLVDFGLLAIEIIDQ